MAGHLIHTKIVIDMRTGNVLEDETYWYDGPMAECKRGGSSSTNSTTNITNVVDEEYNRRLAEKPPLRLKRHRPRSSWNRHH